MSETLSHILFGFTAAMAIASSLLVVTRRNPIYAALYLIVFFGTMSVNFFLMNATFLAFMQLLVYAGAIMVLYIFVIMLINPREGDLPDEGSFPDRGLAAGVALVTFMLLFIGIQRAESLDDVPLFPALPPVPAGHGNVELFGLELFSKHLLVFELTSVLILIAIVGAVHLSLRRRKVDSIPPRPTVKPVSQPREEEAAGV